MNFITLILLVLATLYLTRFFVMKLKDVIIASVLATTMIVLLLMIFDQQEYSKIVFGASFIGMSTTAILENKFYYLAAPLFLFFYYLLGLVFTDLGGLLGLSAFLSVILINMVQNKFLRS